MRILVLANDDIGLYKFRKELLEELLAEGHEIFVSLPCGKYIQLLEQIGCKYINTPVDRRGINPIVDIKLFMAYKRIIKDIHPDLVITYTIKPNIYGGIASRINKTDYAVNITGLGTAFERSGMVKKLVIILYRIALKSAKVVFFENSTNREVLLKNKCCEIDNTCVLNGAGVNTDIYYYQPFPINNQTRFLFIGRVMKEKGIGELFESMQRLTSEGECCCLDVVGPFEEDYRDIIKQYENEGWLNYHGFQYDVRPFIKQCNCFVLPSYHEGMANTILECASCGRPIITSNIPGCREAVIDGESGLLCEPKDVDSLYHAMKRMLYINNKPEMGMRGREYMIEVFDKNKVIERTIEELLR